MTGLIVIAIVLLMHIQTRVNAQCSTPQMQTTQLDEALTALECGI